MAEREGLINKVFNDKLTKMTIAVTLAGAQ
jgi:hypothetical protein